MHRSTRRLAILIAATPVTLLFISWLYMLGMEYLEGEPRSFLQSLEWAAETVTTTGYGRDAEWAHPVMSVFVVVVQFLGVFLVFLVFPVFLIPFFEERFEGRLPTTLPPLKNHVLIYRFGPAVETLVAQLEQHKVPFVIFEEDESTARRLRERGQQVVFSELAGDDPDLSSLKKAIGVVANGDDHDNAVLTLSARNQGFEGKIVAMVTNPARRNPMVRAGASAVFTPVHVLAAAIAAKASVRISPRVTGVRSLGRHLRIAELRIDEGSSLAGTSLAKAGVRANTGATVIGEWVGGDLVAQPDPHARLEVGSILVACGSEESIANLGELARPVVRSGPIVVAGYGSLGSKVRELLNDAGEDVRVISPTPAFGVDVVGDPLDPDKLESLGVKEAQAIVLALEDDSATLFAAAVARDLAPKAAIVAGVNRADNVARIHRAGADFALSVGQVAGQLLAYQLLGEESVSIERQIKLARTATGNLEGKRLMASRVRERTGCSIVGVERDDDVIVEFDTDFVLEPDDAVYVCGTPEAIASYIDIFDAASPAPAAPEDVPEDFG